MMRCRWLAWVLLFAVAGCQPLTGNGAPPAATADAALRQFFNALQSQEYETAKRLISITDLAAEDRDAFIEGCRHIRLQSHEITQRHEFPDGSVRYTVKLVFVPEGETEARERNQEILARRDYRRVWRLKI